MNALILPLFTLSGTSALIYQIVWIRMLSHLLGGTSYAISLVLAAFMGGLAFGSRYFGRRADATSRPLRLYAQLEFGIALTGALAFGLILLAPPAYVWLAHLLPQSALGILRGLIAVVLLFPPTFLMGGTLPVLSRYVVRSRDKLGSGLGLLYAVNTFGAVLGSFLAGYFLVATFGVPVSVLLAIGLNAFIGMGAWWMDRRQEPQPATEALATAAKPARPAAKKSGRARSRGVRDPLPPEISWWLLTFLFACSGFAALGYEIYWTRALQHFLGNSTYAYSAMLTTFLLGLSIGGWFGGRWVDASAAPSRMLGWVQIGIGCSAVIGVVMIWGWLPMLEDGEFFSSARLGWNTYLLRRFLIAGCIMVLPTFLIGMTFPIINHIGIGGLSGLGRGVGFLYFSNTLGAIVGSLAAGFLLLPMLGAKNALLVTGLLNAVIGMVALGVSRRRRGLDLGIAGMVVLALVLLAVYARTAGHMLLADTQELRDLVLFQREDHAAETRVYQKASGELHMSVDAHHIGGTEPNILRKEKILAHLPMMFAPQARTTLSVGLGSGITLGTLAQYEQLQRMDCVEIVPGVVAGAQYFSEAHGDVLHDPRVHIHIGDGVQYLLTTSRRYDIISSDSKLNPEYAGNAPLLSRDYYELCRDRLADAGVMVQWLAVHMPASEFHAIARSFVQAFPYAGLFWYDPYNLVLVGSKEPLRLDLDAGWRFAQSPRLADDLYALQLENPYVFAGMFVAGGEQLRATLGDGPVNTWMRPRLEFTVVREFRRKPQYLHEAENLQWLVRIRKPQDLQLRGSIDEEVLADFRASGLELLKAFAAGSGITRLDMGMDHLKRGADLNPQDRRLAHWIQSVEAASAALEEAAAAGQLNSPEALVRAGLARSEAGRHVEALAYMDRALAMLPNDSNIQYNRLVELRHLKKFAEMRAALDVFHESFPRDPRGFAMQGRLHAEQGDFEAALSSFRESVQLDPNSAVIVNNVATSLARLERNVEAGESFARVAELDADFPGAAYFAAASFSKAGRTKDAAKWMQFCLDHGLAIREPFEEEGFFANLRASTHWIP